MERITIQATDGKTIHGVLNGPLDKPLVFIVHGLSGNVDEALHHNAVPFFLAQGFSVFRISLYSYRPEARKLHEATLEIHGRDIDAALSELKSRGAQKIFMVGHSYGFPSILSTTSRNFEAVVSWDGSLLPHNYFDGLERTEKPAGWILDNGYLVIMGEEMYEEAKTLDTGALLKGLGKPVKLIGAGVEKESGLAEAKKMFEIASEPKDFAAIEGATHCFVEEGVLEPLYQETVSWFKKYL